MKQESSRSRTSWKRSGAKSTSAPRSTSAPTALERSVLRAIADARRIVPGYANGVRATTEHELGIIASAYGARLKIGQIGVPSIVLPPIVGRTHIIVNAGMPRPTRLYSAGHEVGHVVMGDADEPALFYFDGPLPECEMRADLWAFIDQVPRLYCDLGPTYVADFIRSNIHFEYEAWYRRLEIDRIPAQLVRLRQLLDGLI